MSGREDSAERVVATTETVLTGSPEEIIEKVAGDTYKPPREYLPDNVLPGVECRTDPKTGLAIFEGRARFNVVSECGETLQSGGTILLWIYDCDDLKGINDNFSHKAGDGVIAWGSSAPLHELKKLGLSCRTIPVRPEGSPDDTIVIFLNPSEEDKQKLEELQKKQNDPNSVIKLDMLDKNGRPRRYHVSQTGGLAYSPKDNLEVMRQRRMINYDGSPNLAPFTEADLANDLAELQRNPEDFNFTIVEGLRQLADYRGREAKGEKQLRQAEEFLESLMGLPLEEFNRAVRKRFAGSRTSEVVWEAIDRERTLRYFPPE